MSAAEILCTIHVVRRLGGRGGGARIERALIVISVIIKAKRPKNLILQGKIISSTLWDPKVNFPRRILKTKINLIY